MAIITKPDNIYGLASTIGAANNLAAICTSSNINKWAKWKPVNQTSPTLQNHTGNQETTVTQSNPYLDSPESMPFSVGIPSKSQTTMQYGTETLTVYLYRIGQLKVPIINVAGKNQSEIARIAIAAINSFSNPNNGLNWVHEAVSTSGGCWYRQLDFIGYNTDAEQPYLYTVPDPLYSDRSLYATMQWKDIDISDALDSDALSAVLHEAGVTNQTEFVPYVVFTDNSNQMIQKTGFTNPAQLYGADSSSINIGNGYSASSAYVSNPFGYSGVFKAFFYGYCQSKNLLIVMPSRMASTSSYLRYYNNPRTFYNYNTPHDWPWNHLYVSDQKFGYSYNGSYGWEEINSSIYMYTGYPPNGQVALAITLENTGSEAVTINASSFRVTESTYCGSSGSGVPNHTLWNITNPSSPSSVSGSITINPGVANSIRLCFQMNNIWYDKITGTTHNPSSTTSPEPSIEYSNGSSYVGVAGGGEIHLAPTSQSGNWGIFTDRP